MEVAVPPREGGPVAPGTVLALWPPVAPSRRPKKSAVLFFEVEILDARTRDKLCFLDKVEPQATVADIKNLFSKAHPQWYPARQSLRLDPKGRSLKDEDVLQSLPVGTTATLYFRDLGAQISWVTVFLTEYAGPLLIYLLFYFRVPFLYGPRYDFTASRHRVVQVQVPPQVSPVTPPCSPQFCQLGNFSIHVALRNLRPAGSKTRKIPYPTRNPFTWLFLLVSCPNYTYEVGSWIGFTIMTQCLPVALFSLVGFVQMAIWAQGKHRSYLREFRDYPPLRSPIIPFLL
ncbi:very-long-chain enoyl-CoA reductase-like [Parus major]|uniref:very-long-chain enoyl-CoA reductase-like n=1 Tax=Parus major TaxID=9157 RepID=UPI001444749C|nr:very-long-chain enoyl-CoA reductase-like [Parus major]